jgi:hypothetical protein
MKKHFLVSFLLILVLGIGISLGQPVSTGRLNIEELDGSPSTFPYKLKVTNGSLTDNGDGTVTLSLAAGSGDVVAASIAQTWGNGTDPVVWTYSVTGTDPTITFTASTINFGANNLELTGSIGTTGARVTKGWFTNLESTNAPTVNGAALTTILQPLNTNLTDISNISMAKGYTLYYNGTNTVGLPPIGTNAFSFGMVGTVPTWYWITPSKPVCSDANGLPVVCAGTEGVWQAAGSYQTSDATLTALAGLTIADVSIIEGTGVDAFNVVTSGGNNYILGSNADNTALEFKTPANVLSQISGQASHASLTSIAGLTEVAGGVPWFSADNTWGVVAAGTAGQIFTSNGTNSPAFSSTLNISTMIVPNGTGAAPTAEGSAYWNSTNDVLTIGDGATAKTIARTADNLSVFAATTSAQLAGVISDETGTGAVVLANSPTLVTPKGIVERIGATFDGGGSAIAVNKVSYLVMPYAATSIDQWTVVCDVDSGATGIIISMYKNAYAEDTLPTTTMCTTGTPPHTTDGAGAGGIMHQAAWDCNITSITAGDVLAFKVTTAPTSATWCAVTLKVTR